MFCDVFAGSRSSSISGDSCASCSSRGSTPSLPRARVDVTSSDIDDVSSLCATNDTSRDTGNRGTPVKPPPYSKNPPTYKDIYVINTENSRQSDPTPEPPPYTSDALPQSITPHRNQTMTTSRRSFEMSVLVSSVHLHEPSADDVNSDLTHSSVDSSQSRGQLGSSRDSSRDSRLSRESSSTGPQLRLSTFRSDAEVSV